MPRLSDPRITKGHAANFLVCLYLREPDFLAELYQLREDHLELLAELVARQVGFFAKSRAVLTTEQYQNTIRDLYGLHATQGRIPGLPASLTRQLERIKQIGHNLGPYFRGLEELAARWKLRAPWAGPMLHLYAMHDCLKALGVPDTIDVPLEQMDLLYPWPPPMPPLEITVSAWAFVFYGRKQIQGEVARKLKDYESRLKAVGLKEKPSALEIHARWWFEHYVKGKPYRELAQQFPRVYEETIKRKVWEFSRLAGIGTR